MVRANTPSSTRAWTCTWRFTDPPKRWMTAIPAPRGSARPWSCAQARRYRSTARCSKRATPPAQVVVPGQHVPDSVRDAQDPLAYRYIWQHVIDQVGGAFGHSAPATARAEAATLAREGDEPFGLAVATAEPREAAGEETTPQERPELLLDEPRQPVAVPKPRRLDAERLEVVAHDGVQDRRARVSRGWYSARTHTGTTVPGRCQRIRSDALRPRPVRASTRGVSAYPPAA